MPPACFWAKFQSVIGITRLSIAQPALPHPPRQQWLSPMPCAHNLDGHHPPASSRPFGDLTHSLCWLPPSPSPRACGLLPPAPRLPSLKFALLSSEQVRFNTCVSAADSRLASMAYAQKLAQTRLERSQQRSKWYMLSEQERTDILFPAPRSQQTIPSRHSQATGRGLAR